MDFETYCIIMRASGAKFDIVDPLRHGLRNVSGVLATQEEQIIFTLAPTNFFRNRLGVIGSYTEKGIGTDGKPCIQLSTKIENVEAITNSSDQNESDSLRVTWKKVGPDNKSSSENDNSNVSYSQETFDWVLDCTYGAFRGIPKTEVFYEPCLTLVYRYIHANSGHPLRNTVSVTIMDGPDGCSLYPYIASAEQLRTHGCCQLYTLTSVEHTPLGRYRSSDEAERKMREIQKDENFILQKKKPKFEQNMGKYYPRFFSDFKLEGWFCSVKTKLTNEDGCANRECIVERAVPENQGPMSRFLHVLSGKINTMFEAERRVLNLVANAVTLDGQMAQPSLFRAKQNSPMVQTVQ